MTPQEKAEACKATLAEMRGWHFREIAEYDCGHCDDLWPCDAARLLDYAEARLKRALEVLANAEQHSRHNLARVNRCTVCRQVGAVEAEIESLYQFLGLKE